MASTKTEGGQTRGLLICSKCGGRTNRHAVTGVDFVQCYNCFCWFHRGCMASPGLLTGGTRRARLPDRNSETIDPSAILYCEHCVRAIQRLHRQHRPGELLARNPVSLVDGSCSIPAVLPSKRQQRLFSQLSLLLNWTHQLAPSITSAQLTLNSLRIPAAAAAATYVPTSSPKIGVPQCKSLGVTNGNGRNIPRDSDDLKADVKQFQTPLAASRMTEGSLNRECSAVKTLYITIRISH